MITDDFIKKGLKVVPEVSDKRFSMVDDGGVETETGEFLYGFIRRLKPTNVLTTGIYTGVSDLYVARALKDNGFGHSTALELDQVHIRRAIELWVKMEVAEYITPVFTSSLNFIPDKKYQFMFLDTEPNIRFKELVNFYPFLDYGGYVFIHDTPRGLTQGNINPDHPEIRSWPFGDVPHDMRDLLDVRALVPFYLGGARGLVGFYKVHKEDYI